ncbi:MAG TPA: cysteine peptidase family C39 domain-containing protein, partial [Cystobacter sp.]
MTPTEPKTKSLLDRFPVLRELQARLRERRVPVVHQLSATECGAACLTMVLNYHGRAMRLEEVRDLLGPQRDGLSALQLLQAARRFGLRGRGVSLDSDSLEFLPAGAILHWRFSHFVVFERLSKHGVDIVDPAIGRQRLPLEEFLRAFTGVALLLEPGDNFETSKEGPRRTSRYVKELFRQSDSLTRILVASFMLQLFALAIPALTGLVVDRVVPRGDQHLLLVLSLGLAAIAVFNLMASLIRSHMLVELRTRIDSSLSLGFLEHLVSLSYAFFQVRSSGDLLARMNTNTNVREILSSTAVSGILDGSLVLLYLVIILAASPSLGLLVLGLATAQLLIFLFSRKLQGELMARSLEMESQSQGYQVELLTGIQSLKAYG